MISELRLEISGGLCVCVCVGVLWAFLPKTSHLLQMLLFPKQSSTRKDGSSPRARSLQLDSPIFLAQRLEPVILGPKQVLTGLLRAF